MTPNGTIGTYNEWSIVFKGPESLVLHHIVNGVRYTAHSPTTKAVSDKDFSVKDSFILHAGTNVILVTQDGDWNDDIQYITSHLEH